MTTPEPEARPPLDLSSARQLYPAAARHVYLDVAAVGLISTRVEEAMEQVTRAHASRGAAAWEELTAIADHARRVVAELVGGRAERVSFTQNTSTGLALVANGIDWRPGDSVVVPAGEFPSNFYPWTQIRRYGVDVREVPMVDGHANLAALASVVDRTTRVLAISTVQYSSGHRYDLARLGELCRARDVLFVVDGTQSLGALVLDADAVGIDVLAVSAHKWMLGPCGIGFVHLSDRAFDRLHPSTAGWLSVEQPFDFDHEPRLATDGRRFESGTQNAAGIAGLAAAIGIVLELGRDEVEAAVIEHTAQLQEVLAAHGLRILRGHDRRDWSGILIATTGANDRAVVEQLAATGVQCSLRGSGIRLSPHYYTSQDDVMQVDRVLSR